MSVQEIPGSCRLRRIVLVLRPLRPPNTRPLVGPIEKEALISQIGFCGTSWKALVYKAKLC